MKAGDIVYSYAGTADWFEEGEDDVTIENAFDSGVVVSHSGGLGVVPIDTPLNDKGYPSMVCVNKTSSYHPTKIAALKESLKSSKDYARLLDLECQWLSEQIKKLEAQ